MDPTKDSTPTSNPVPDSVPPEDLNEPVSPALVDKTTVSPVAQPDNADETNNVPVVEPSDIPLVGIENSLAGSEPSSNMEKKKNKTTFIVLIVIFLLILCALLGVLIFQLIGSGDSSRESSLSGDVATLESTEEPNDGSASSGISQNGSSDGPNINEDNSSYNSPHFRTGKISL